MMKQIGSRLLCIAMVLSLIFALISCSRAAPGPLDGITRITGQAEEPPEQPTDTSGQIAGTPEDSGGKPEDTEQPSPDPDCGHEFLAGSNVCSDCGKIKDTNDFVFFQIDGSTNTANVSGTNIQQPTAVVLPDQYQGYEVTGIGDFAFQNCSLTGVTIPDSVISIGIFAFDNCNILTHVMIPQGVKQLGRYVFYGCSALSSITIPDSVVSIEDSAFFGCSNLTSIQLGNGIKNIGMWAFGSSGLTDITIPASVTNIEKLVFSDCRELKSITVDENNPKYHSAGNCLIETASKTLIAGCKASVIPDENSVTSLGDSAFQNCIGLASIAIPASVTSMGSNPFYGCKSLIRITVDENNPKYHSAGNCLIETASKALIVGCQASVIPVDGSVVVIGPYAFSNCGNLTSITIPDGVTSISDYAFYYCNHLTSVVIPASVTSIGWGVFYFCSGLVSITVDENNPTYHSAGNCLIETKSKTLIVGCQASVIPNDGSVTSIGVSAFHTCLSLETLTIPDSVTSIGEGAFSNCLNLKEITLGNGVKSIGPRAFSSCGSLTSIAIPDGVTSIGEGAFGRCSSLKSVTIGSGLKSIAFYAFNGCNSLTNIFFCGTIEQWQELPKGDGWNGEMGNYTVHCTDGDILNVLK